MRRLFFGALFLASSWASASDIGFSAFTENIDKNIWCSIKINMPVLVALDTASPTTRDLVSHTNQDWHDRAEALKKEWLSDINSSTEMCGSISYANEVKYSFEIKTPLDAQRVSILFTYYSFSGGAHGNAMLEAETFDAKTGEHFSNLAALFNDEMLPSIKTAILEKLKQDPEFDPEFGFNGWAKEANSLSKLNNFYFTEDGMAIFFQQYEVGPYAAGNITAHFDWDELRSLGIKILPEH